jgi:hypothetical protein
VGDRNRNVPLTQRLTYASLRDGQREKCPNARTPGVTQPGRNACAGVTFDAAGVEGGADSFGGRNSIERVLKTGFTSIHFYISV